MAHHVFFGILSSPDDDFLSGCSSHPVPGSEMRIRTILAAALLALWAVPAFSQGCAMCSSAAAATSKNGQRAISKAVVVLLVPPSAFMTLGIWLAFRYGKQRDIETLHSPTD